MNVFSRGIRNAFRSGIRTLGIVVILALSVGLALSMLVARTAVEQKIKSVKESVGTNITISPAGTQGFNGGGNPLTTDELKSVATVAHVKSVTSSLQDRLTSDNTSLKSAVSAGSLGQRFSRNSGVGFERMGGSGSNSDSSQDSSSGPSDNQSFTRTFTPPVTVTGTNSLADASIYGGSKVSYTSGKALDASSTDNVAVIGKALATKNSLKVGDTFTAYGTKISVVGIYDTGTEFANSGVIMPLATVQKLSDQSGDITSATAVVDSSDNLSSTTSAIEKVLGSKADVTNEQETADNAVTPLKSVASIALYSLVGSIVAGSVIIFLTMMMIVRERRREIGVMKAIGSGNVTTTLQFMIEAVTLTVVGLIIGFIFTIFAAGPITKALVTSSSSSTTSEDAGPSGNMRVGGPARSFNRAGRQVGANIKAVETSIDASTLGFGILAALIIAIVGSAVPAYFISKVRPSEVMRAE